jgi:hypothetical protein
MPESTRPVTRFTTRGGGLPIGKLLARLLSKNASQSSWGAKGTLGSRVQALDHLGQLPGDSLQDFLLSSGCHMRYTYAQAAVPVPTQSSARLNGLGRVGDDL